MVNVRVERAIAASPDRVFDWLASPQSVTSAPLVLKAGWVPGSSSGPAVGAVRKVIGIGMWFREEITAYDAPRTYSYRIIGSFPPFDHEGGTMTFTPVGSRTQVDWVSTYTHPTRAGGKAMEAISSRLLRWNFTAVLAGCAKALEG